MSGSWPIEIWHMLEPHLANMVYPKPMNALVFIRSWPYIVGKLDLRQQNWSNQQKCHQASLISTKCFRICAFNLTKTILLVRTKMPIPIDCMKNKQRNKKKKILKSTVVPRYLPNCPCYSSCKYQNIISPFALLSANHFRWWVEAKIVVCI